MSQFEMKLSKKTIVVSSVIFLSLAVLITILAIVRINENKQKHLIKTLQETADVQIKGFVYTEVGKDQDKWEVKAETATYDKKQNLAVLELIKIKLVTSNGKVFTMKADKGLIVTDKKNIEINGNVVITSGDGDIFSTDNLKYDYDDKKIYTDASVMMKNKRMKITGKGLVIFMNKGELNIPSMVKARIN
jgi:LPS export ABC transporter protein LptC